MNASDSLNNTKPSALALALAIFLQSGAAIAGDSPVSAAARARSGVYCVDGGRSKFYESARADGSLMIELEAAGGPSKSGVFSIYGPARKISANHWRYEDGMESSDSDKCRVDITLDAKGWHLLTSKDARCLSNKGAGAPNEAPPFPISSYVAPVTTQLNADGGEMTGDDCKPRAAR